MDWITDGVAIGTRSEVQDSALVRTAGFRSALSLDGALSGVDPADIGLAEIVVVPLRDGSGNDLRTFRHAVESLTRLAAAQPPVLVQCEYGRSRSPAVVAGYLMCVQGLDPWQARALIATKRDISISAALLPFLFQL